MTDQKKSAGNPLWQKGVSGNPSGKRALKILTDRLRMELTQHPERVAKIAEAVIAKAEDGDLAAATMIWDRLEGRPLQTMEINATTTMLTPEERRMRVLELQARLVGSGTGDDGVGSQH